MALDDANYRLAMMNQKMINKKKLEEKKSLED